MRPCEFSSVHSVPAEAFWRRRGIRSRATVWYGLMAAGHFSGRRGGEGGEAHFERRDVKHPRRAPPAPCATRAARHPRCAPPALRATRAARHPRRAPSAARVMSPSCHRRQQNYSDAGGAFPYASLRQACFACRSSSETARHSSFSFSGESPFFGAERRAARGAGHSPMRAFVRLALPVGVPWRRRGIPRLVFRGSRLFSGRRGGRRGWRGAFRAT